jgi:hypothetical protein
MPSSRSALSAGRSALSAPRALLRPIHNAIDKFDAADIFVLPYQAAALCRLETIERQIKPLGENTGPAKLKACSLVVKISHQTGVNAGNAIKVQHRELIDWNSLQTAAFDHRISPKKKNRSSRSFLVDLTAFNRQLKVRPIVLLKLHATGKPPTRSRFSAFLTSPSA